MVKAKKLAIAEEESKRDDTFDIASTLEAEHSDEPQIDESRYERTDEYGNVIDASNDDDADIDHLPDDDGEGRDHVNGDEGGGVPLLNPKQLKSLDNKAEQLRRPTQHMKCDDRGERFPIGEVDVKGAKAVAAIDWLINRRSLWVGNKSVESHDHLAVELNGKAPPRPNTFTKRENWKKYHSKGKETDPWGNIQTILPFITASGGIISFQANSAATRAAVGELVSAFIKSGGKRRPIVQFTSAVNPETGESFPVFRIVGFVEVNEDLSFLRETADAERSGIYRTGRNEMDRIRERLRAERLALKQGEPFPLCCAQWERRMPDSISDYSLEDIARILGGDVHGSGAGRYAMVPGPGHSAKDRSLRIDLGPQHPDGFLVYSHAGDDHRVCKDYIREKLSLPAFPKANGERRPAKKLRETVPPIQEPKPIPQSIDGLTPDERLEAAMSGASPSALSPEHVPGLKFVEAYPYPDASGKVTYQNCRYLKNDGAGPKTFRPWHRANGKWRMGLTGIEQIPHRLDEFAKHPHAPIVICEGEKDANNVRNLGYVATNVAAGWWQKSAKYFSDREVTILADFNKAGTIRALEAANALHGVARSIKMIFLPGQDGSDGNRDVSDWLKNPGNDANKLAEIYNHAPLWSPGDVVERFAAAELVVPGNESDTPPAAPLKLTYFDDCGAFIDKHEIFKNLLAIGETSGWIGPPGSGKSALLTEVSIHCVREREWRGFKYKAKRPLSVLILALERADLYKRRLHAYSLRDKMTGLPIAVAGAVVDLLNPACVEIIVSTAREVEKKFSRPVGLIVLDTYAKGIAASGGDEDKARDQNRAAVHLREIHSRIPVHIALVGHTGKDESRGARGSNAHLGDVDLMNQINSDTEIKVVEVTKANDAPMGIIAGFKIESFDLGPDSDGDPRQTSILDSNQYLASKKAKRREPTGKAKAALHSLFETIADGKIIPKPNDPHVPKGVTSGTSLSHWKCDALSRGILNREGNHREEFKRIHVTLQNLGLIGVWEDFVWPVT